MRRSISIALMMALSTTLSAQAQRPSRVRVLSVAPHLTGTVAQAQAVLPQVNGVLAQVGASMPLVDAALAQVHAYMPQVHAVMPQLDAALSGLNFSLPVLHMATERYVAPPMPQGTGNQQDPADVLWRQAREQMNDQNFRRAAELFERLIERHESHALAREAFYWQAYSLYKIGGTDELEEARDLLEEQRRRFPRASTRGEADKLLVTVRGQLAQRGDADAAQQVTRTARSAQQGCPQRDEDDVRMTALNAVLQMDATNAMPILKQVMTRRDACSAPLRRQAMFLISQKNTSEREDLLLSAARTDPDPEVKQQAIFWLGQINSSKALDAIEDVLENSSDRKVQEQAIFALSQNRAPRASQILRDWARSDARPVDLRGNAIFWLGQRREPENGRFLREIYPSLPTSLKDRVLHAMSQRPGGEGNDKWLMDIALDEKEDIKARKQALFWAGQMRTTNVQDLVNLYERTTDLEMKKQLIFVYSQRRDDATLLKMIDIAKSEKNKTLRENAIFWLGQSKDPRAVKAILDIIG